MGNRLHHLVTTAYPVGHGTTYREYRRSYESFEKTLKAMYAGIDRLGLYVHIPFCERRCRYCEYTVLEKYSEDLEAEYETLLLKELQLYSAVLRKGTKRAVGLDIGGGTPTLMKTEFISRIVEFVKSYFILEPGFAVSIETTPLIAVKEPDKLRALRNAGIERISMGIQTTSSRLLAEHGRDYMAPDMNRKAVRHIRQAGFKTFNIDIMYGFARQGTGDLLETLKAVLALSPDCITTYRMRYKGTRVEEDKDQVTMAEVNRLYTALASGLAEAGYHAAPGKNTYSRLPGDTGLSAYLAERVIQGTPYLGFGLGAQSFTGSLLCYNMGAATKNMDSYRKALKENRLPIQDIYLLPREEGMAKMLSVSFYSGAIHLPSFRRLFGTALGNRFPCEIEFLLTRGLMEYRGDSLVLTEKGALSIHGILALFYSDGVKKYLLQKDDIRKAA
jgi:oxygen-independent coproporphyrinogen-3 oxidase